MDDRPLFEAPLKDLLPVAAPPPKPPTFNDPATGPAAVVRDRSDADLVAIGRGQRWLIRLVAAHALLLVGYLSLTRSLGRPADGGDWVLIDWLAGAAGFTTSLAALVVVIRLAARLYRTPALVALSLCQLLPVVGTIALLVMNARATAELRRNGVRVGLLGARRADLGVLAPMQRKKGDVRLPKLGW